MNCIIYVWFFLNISKRIHIYTLTEALTLGLCSHGHSLTPNMSGRVSVQDLKTHTGVTDTQLALQCTDEHLNQLAPKVPNWFTLAVTLGLEEYQRNAIKVNLDLEYLYKTIEVLKVWKKKMGREATYLRLVRGCLEMSNALLAGDVCTLAKSKYIF